MTSGALVSPASLHDVQTPCLLLERHVLDRNVARMEARCRDLGVAFRPHLKTAKSVDVARRIPSAAAHGITVSTVKEVEYFASHGFPDILYAVTATPHKLERLAAVRRAGSDVRLACDCAEGATAIAAAAREHGVRFGVLLEIDSGEHRSGVAPSDAAVTAIAKRLDGTDSTTFDGVFTHAGHSYDCRSPEAVRTVAEQERSAVVSAAATLRDAGLPSGIVSVGSTPTLVQAESLEGVTEARAGVFAFGDLFQAGISSCDHSDIAVTVLTTVVGRQRNHGRILVDAGGLALSKDRSTAALGPGGDAGYGLVADEYGDLLHGYRVAAAYQEHGVIERSDGAVEFDAFPVGRRLRILPNHACMTCAAYDRYHVLERGRIERTWPRINEWI